MQMVTDLVIIAVYHVCPDRTDILLTVAMARLCQLYQQVIKLKVPWLVFYQVIE